jgi:hypothetical protein
MNTVNHMEGWGIPEGWEEVPSGVTLTTEMFCRSPYRYVGWDRVINGGLAGLIRGQVDSWRVIRKVEKTKT